MTTGADITALVAMLRHIQCEPASFDTYSMASAAERAADAIERLSLSATTAADISPDAVDALVERLLEYGTVIVKPLSTQDACCHDSAHMIEALRSAMTASEKDAARYQWLREQMHIAGAAIVEVLQPAGDWGNSVTAESPEGLDAAIDAAMEKANG